MEELLTVARSLTSAATGPTSIGSCRRSRAPATSGYDALLEALDGDVAEIIAVVTARLVTASPAVSEGAAELFDHFEVPVKALLAGDDLRVLLAYDLPDGVMLLPEGWGDQDLFAQAIARVRGEPGLRLDRHEVTLDDDAAPLYVLHGPSMFTSTHALWADEFEPPAPDYGTLVAVPTRNAVLAHPIRDARVAGVIEPMSSSPARPPSRTPLRSPRACSGCARDGSRASMRRPSSRELLERLSR